VVVVSPGKVVVVVSPGKVVVVVVVVAQGSVVVGGVVVGGVVVVVGRGGLVVGGGDVLVVVVPGGRGFTVVVVVGAGGGGGGADGGGTSGARRNRSRYRSGCGNASSTMSWAFCDMLTTIDPCSSHGIRWAWYVFINGSPSRGSASVRDTVVHGPHGSRATSMNSSSPQNPSRFVAATHWPPRNRGCVGFSAQNRETIVLASDGSSLHPRAVRYSGVASR
jgi:hypothetical protein